MTGITDIINLSLAKIACDPIDNSQVTSPQAELGNLMYEPIKKRLLRSHPWNFAINRTELGLRANSPGASPYQRQDITSLTAPVCEPFYDYGYDHIPNKFPLPIDCLRVLRLLTPFGRQFQIEGRNLVAFTHHATIEYIANVIDPNLFDPNFTDCLITLLASEMAFKLTQSAQLAASLKQEFITSLRQAKRFDGQEGTPKEFLSDSLYLASRWGW